ncbi:MAG: helix-turn-helix transcriptional regulator [Clostridia bacterium]|nr:helix-turn-helix transcriptional regulator [Clostridia bacterium]
MGKREFDIYLYEYSDKYYEKNNSDVQILGDSFYECGEETLYCWVASQKNMYIYQKDKLNTPLYKNEYNFHEEDLPAYAIALNALFFSEYDFVNERGEIERKKRSDIRQETIADICNVKRNTVSSWKNGTRKPGKYSWLAFAICFLRLDYSDILPFMDMIGEVLDRNCLDDMLLYYALCSGKSRFETYMLLKRYNCTSTMEYFKPL